MALTAVGLTGFTNEWGWSKVTMGGGNTTVNLTIASEHTLEVYMREDGLRMDRMLLVTDTNYIPTGLGPPRARSRPLRRRFRAGWGRRVSFTNMMLCTA